jgi:hypothetical protein
LIFAITINAKSFFLILLPNTEKKIMLQIFGIYKIENKMLNSFLEEYVLNQGLEACIISETEFSTKIILYEPTSFAEC